MIMQKKSFRSITKWAGTNRYAAKAPLDNKEDLEHRLYTGVDQACMVIHDEPEKVWGPHGRQQSLAVITERTAVLGLGDIGPEACKLPVMEGKCVLFNPSGGGRGASYA